MNDLEVYELVREAPLRSRRSEAEARPVAREGVISDEAEAERAAGSASPGEQAVAGQVPPEANAVEPAAAGLASSQEAVRPGLELPLWSHFVVLGIPCAIVFGMLAFAMLVLMMFDEAGQFHRLAGRLVDSTEVILSQVRDLEVPGWASALLILLSVTGLLLRQETRAGLFNILLTILRRRGARRGGASGVVGRAGGVPALLIDLRREAINEALASRGTEQPLIAVHRGTAMADASPPGQPPSPPPVDRQPISIAPVGTQRVLVGLRRAAAQQALRLSHVHASSDRSGLTRKLVPAAVTAGLVGLAFVAAPRAISHGSFRGLLEGTPGASASLQTEEIAPSALMPDQSELRRRIALEGARSLEPLHLPKAGQAASGWFGTVFDRSGIPLATHDAMAISARRSDLETLNPRLDRACPHPEQRCFPLGRATYDVLAMAGQSTLNQTLTIDARLQLEVTRILERRIRTSGLEEAAAIVLRPSTGEILAMTSVPGSTGFERALKGITGRSSSSDNLAAFGLKPPGSTFKLVTAMAALRRFPGTIHSLYRCKALGDDRVGAFIPEVQRTIRDDELDRSPHGLVNLERGLRVSCNAFFAQLAVDTVKADALIETAGIFGIQPAHPNTPAELNKTLDQAAFGQGEVLATPLQMAMVAGTVANHGVLVRPTLNLEVARQKAPDSRIPVVTPEQADLLARGMRGVVISGTAHEALNRGSLPPIAGKTGTAEVEDEPSHAWFIGYAPFLEPGVPMNADSGQQIAFAVLLPNAGYGGRNAAPVAGEIVQAAQSLGFIPATGTGARAVSMASFAASRVSSAARP